MEPESLLMDEWIGAGDPKFQDKARKWMAELADRAGIIVLTSYNQGLIKKVCNRVLELEGGRVKRLAEARK